MGEFEKEFCKRVRRFCVWSAKYCPMEETLPFFLSSYWVSPTLPTACTSELHILYTVTQREERGRDGGVGFGDLAQIRRQQRLLSVFKHIPFAIRRMSVVYFGGSGAYWEFSYRSGTLFFVVVFLGSRSLS